MGFLQRQFHEIQSLFLCKKIHNKAFKILNQVLNVFCVCEMYARFRIESLLGTLSGGFGRKLDAVATFRRSIFEIFFTFFNIWK